MTSHLYQLVNIFHLPDKVKTLSVLTDMSSSNQSGFFSTGPEVTKPALSQISQKQSKQAIIHLILKTINSLALRYTIFSFNKGKITVILLN